jgi:hypothetical protein
VRKAKSLEKHAYVWRVILLDEENKEAWVDKYHESFMAKLNDINRNKLSRVDKLIVSIVVCE